jgi:hypothetical protein
MHVLNHRTVIASSLLTLSLIFGCFVDNSQPENPEVLELSQFPDLKVDSSEFWYQYLVYTSLPYFGKPDSALTLLASLGVFPEEVWATTGDACIQNGEPIAPNYTFIMRIDRDLGRWIFEDEDQQSPVMMKVPVNRQWELGVESCDSGRQLLHYRL